MFTNPDIELQLLHMFWRQVETSTPEADRLASLGQHAITTITLNKGVGRGPLARQGARRPVGSSSGMAGAAASTASDLSDSIDGLWAQPAITKANAAPHARNCQVDRSPMISVAITAPFLNDPATRGR